MSKIFFGSDKGGTNLRMDLIDYSKQNKFDFEDLGETFDYPDIAKEVCNRVLKENGIGVLICGTGIGMSITANKIKGIRAALVHNSFEAGMAKKHNNANVICMGGRVIGAELAKDCFQNFLDNKFEGGRHEERVKKLEN